MGGYSGSEIGGETLCRRKPLRAWGAKLPALGNFCNFSIKINHFYINFSQNSYFKAITHQLKAFEKQSKHTK